MTKGVLHISEHNCILIIIISSRNFRILSNWVGFLVFSWISRFLNPGHDRGSGASRLAPKVIFLRKSQVKSSKSQVMTWLFWKNQKSQSHDFDFSEKTKNWKKSKSWLWLWLDFLTFFTIFSFFFRYFDSKKGPNSPKVCLKCKILTKWPFGTKRKRQNVFSRSP